MTRSVIGGSSWPKAWQKARDATKGSTSKPAPPRMAPPRMLGIDTGLATLGWAVLEFSEDGRETVVRLGAFRTQKSDAKRRVYASDDNYRRAQELAVEMFDLITKWRPRVVAAEAQSWPRNSQACAQIGMCWGIMAAWMGTLMRIPMVQPGPQEVRRALLGTKKASKEEVAEAVRHVRPEIGKLLLQIEPASMRVHAIDAVAVMQAALDSEIVRAVRAGSWP